MVLPSMAGRTLVNLLIASAGEFGMRDTSMPITGSIQMPVQCVDVKDVNASVATTFDAKYAINSDCNYSRSKFDNNQLFIEGSAVFDTGCVRPLFKPEYEPLMKSVHESMLSISGFDEAAESKNGRKHGQSDMYFLSIDRNRPSKGQGVSNYTFDTVDDLCDNLFACSRLYEEGAEIHLTHGASFSGI